jgi:cell division protein FtsQ
LEFEGNAHVTRAQLLGIFGEDVERNIFNVSLVERRAQLERLPWVANATVMRLLPNRMRVSIVERKPVAFVRQGSHIGLVDANGVLLDMPVDAKARERFSFPVVTGISAGDPVSTRAARMKIFERFTSELDGAGEKAPGEKISEELSEVDLSNPEDVKALIPDHSTEILVHFGEDNFLDRYRRFKEHLPEWRTVYPKLSSVDMRYERQVVLEMQPGSGVPVASSPSPAASSADANSASAKALSDADKGTATKLGSKPVAKPTARPIVRPNEKVATGAKAAAKSTAHGTAKKIDPKSKTHAVAANHHPASAKSDAARTQYHPQVVHP